MFRQVSTLDGKRSEAPFPELIESLAAHPPPPFHGYRTVERLKKPKKPRTCVVVSETSRGRIPGGEADRRAGGESSPARRQTASLFSKQGRIQGGDDGAPLSLPLDLRSPKSPHPPLWAKSECFFMFINTDIKSYV